MWSARKGNLAARLGGSGRPAAAVLEVPDLRLIECNAEYQDLLQEPYRSEVPIGVPLLEFAPVGYASTADALMRVGRSGNPESGEEIVFSVEEGSIVYRWLARRPRYGRVVMLIWSVDLAGAESSGV